MYIIDYINIQITKIRTQAQHNLSLMRERKKWRKYAFLKVQSWYVGEFCWNNKRDRMRTVPRPEVKCASERDLASTFFGCCCYCCWLLLLLLLFAAAVAFPLLRV